MNQLRTRLATNVPTSERNLNALSSSSTLVTNINLPEIVLLEANLPLKIIVPTSRQQVPMGSSASPEKLTRSFVSSDQTAGTVIGLSSAAVSRSLKEPEPLSFVWKIKFFLSPVISNVTCQRPSNRDIGACAWASEPIVCPPATNSASRTNKKLSRFFKPDMKILLQNFQMKL